MSGLYDDLTTAYQNLTTRPQPWLASLDHPDLDSLVTAIRTDQPDPTASDQTLRALVALGRHEPDALTVALYALAPRLRARLGRATTDEYRHDVLTDLATVLLDSNLDGARLANRLVNRAHNRTHKAAGRVAHRGTRHPMTVLPLEPEHLANLAHPGDDPATIATRRADLERFADAVRTAIDAGLLSERAWAAYRDHRLRRALHLDDRVANNYERTTAARTAPKLEPLIATYLHAA